MNAQAANQSMLRKLAFVACVMFGFGFALVPFYKKICEVTGIGNLLQADSLPANTQVDLGRVVTIEFDAATRGLPWSFVPAQRSLKAHPGELVHAVYEVRNDSAHAVIGQAIPSYAPNKAAQYFKKLECFCFSKQELAPGEVRRMPVVFVVDPDMPKDIGIITLSYTFFELNRVNGAKAGGAGEG